MDRVGEDAIRQTEEHATRPDAFEKVHEPDGFVAKEKSLLGEERGCEAPSQYQPHGKGKATDRK